MHIQSLCSRKQSILGNDNVSTPDCIHNVVWVLAIYCATHRLCRSWKKSFFYESDHNTLKCQSSIPSSPISANFPYLVQRIANVGVCTLLARKHLHHHLVLYSSKNLHSHHLSLFYAPVLPFFQLKRTTHFVTGVIPHPDQSPSGYLLKLCSLK